MECVAIVALLALLQYLYFATLVGQARGKYGVNGPAVTGHPVFERYFRVQMNTLELLIVLLPGLWLFAYYVRPTWAALLGAVYLVPAQLRDRSRETRHGVRAQPAADLRPAARRADRRGFSAFARLTSS